VTHSLTVDSVDELRVCRADADTVQIIITDLVDNRYILEIPTAEVLHTLTQQLMYYSLTDYFSMTTSEESEDPPF
jgi:hypothetical protein